MCKSKLLPTKNFVIDAEFIQTLSQTIKSMFEESVSVVIITQLPLTFPAYSGLGSLIMSALLIALQRE